MSKSEAGKLGAAKFSENLAKRMIKTKNDYSLCPSRCSFCNSSLEYEKKNYKFCSRSCAASYNNLRRPTKTTDCLYCGRNGIKGKWCSHRCRFDYEYQRDIDLWLSDQNTQISKSKKYKYVRAKSNNSCAICGIVDWNGSKITLQIDHINGNSDDDSLANLRLLCPNCHSQTPTYGSKNKGNGRHYRRLRYAQGKSS